MITAILHGITLAFGLILPLGAQNVFVFNQGAGQKRFRKALPVILTASLCDTLLILLAVLGVSVLVLTVQWMKLLLWIAGFFFLLYMGWSVWRSSPGSMDEKGQALGGKQQIAFTLSVSLLNPHAILDTIGIIGTSSLYYEGAEKIAFTAACIVVSWLWFLGLAATGRIIRRKDETGVFLHRINQASAFIIWAVAVYIGIEIIKSI